MKKYLSLFKIRFSNTLQYKTAAFAGILTQFAWGFMEILAFNAFYRTNPGAFPMGIEQTASYIWLQQALLALFMVWFFENEIFDAIMSGNIAYELVRPIDLYNRWFFQNIANRSAKAILRCFPIFLVSFFLPKNIGLSLPDNFLIFIVFIFSMLLSLLVVVAFSMLIYVLTFYTVSNRGLRIIAAILADFLSGSVIPIPFFPDNWQKVLNILPFASMQNMPLRIYIGNINGTEILKALILQISWIIILVFIGKAIMKNALKKVIVQGG